ncbi:MAG: ATP-dependent Clp protease adaptor ClpS [Bacteroidia bacterium]|jgi:ATP-dependent Clp protease adaptor protein ClpS
MSKEYVKHEELLEVLDDVGTIHKLILFNDDVNSFDHVIECLVRICDHNEIQAEQSALIVHYKGKATVKSGDRGELAAMCQALCEEGLSAVIGE